MLDSGPLSLIDASRREVSEGETEFMRVNRRRVPVLMLAAAMGLLGLLIVQVTGASHVRPKGASPLRASLVPAYKLCGPGGGTPNRTHGGPLGVPVL